MLTSAPWAIPLYGVCVAACPQQGDYVSDYGCDASHSRCQWAEKPLATWYTSEYHKWHVDVTTTPTLNRCLPGFAQRTDTVTLCAYPNCFEANKPCYTAQFPDASYWLPEGDATAAGCEEVVTVETTRTLAAKHAELELEFMSGFFGGFLGITTDLYLGALELCVCGVLVSLIINFALMFILRHFVRALFYGTVLLLLIALTLVDCIAFAKAGTLDMPGLSTQALSRSTPLVSPAAAAADKEWWLMAGYICSFLTFVIAIWILFLWSKVENALEICREATTAVFDNKALILLPLVSTAVSIAVMGYFALVLVYILTPDPENSRAMELITQQIDSITHTLTEQTVELTEAVTDAAVDVTNKAIETTNNLAEQALHDGPDKEFIGGHLPSVDLDPKAAWGGNVSGLIAPGHIAHTAIIYEGVSAIWVLLFVDAVVYCTIAGAITYWYQERPGKGVFPSLCRVLRYHLGSMALGSGVIVITHIPRLLFIYIDGVTTRHRENTLSKLAIKCFSCCLWCLEHCIKFLTKFSYVYVAADGYSFCSGGVKTHTLVSKHPLQMLTNEATLGVLSLLMTMLTPLFCALLAYFAVLREWRDLIVHASVGFARDIPGFEGVVTEERVVLVDHYVASSVAGLPDWAITGPPNAFTIAGGTLLVSFWITQMFRMVYAATVDTLFVCMFRDDDFIAGKYSHASGETPGGRSSVMHREQLASPVKMRHPVSHRQPAPVRGGRTSAGNSLV